MKSGIYLITIANYKYVGMSSNLNERKSSHLCNLNKNKHINKKMQYIFNKYKSFNFEILEHCPIEFMIDLEKKYISIYKTYKTKYGLNMTIGGDLPPVKSGKDHPFYGKKRGSQTIQEKLLKSKKNISFNKDEIILIKDNKEYHLKDYISLNEFADRFNLNPSNITTMIKYKNYTSCGGFKMKNPRHGKPQKRCNYYKSNKLKSPSGEIIPLGEYSNILEFCKKYNLDNSTILKLLKNQVKSSKGWTLYE